MEDSPAPAGLQMLHLRSLVYTCCRLDLGRSCLIQDGLDLIIERIRSHGKTTRNEPTFGTSSFGLHRSFSLVSAAYWATCQTWSFEKTIDWRRRIRTPQFLSPSLSLNIFWNSRCSLIQVDKIDIHSLQKTGIASCAEEDVLRFTSFNAIDSNCIADC